MRRNLWRLAAGVFVVALIGALALTLRDQDWSVVGTLLAARDPVQITVVLAAAALVNLAGLVFGLLAWRVILGELGPPVPLIGVVRIFLVGFLGKYIPGRVPGLLATARVAGTAGVSFARLATAGALSMSLVVLTGLTVGLLASAQVLGAQAVWPALGALAVAVVVIRPQIVDAAQRRMLRLLRKEPPARAASPRGVRLAVAAQSFSWVVSGLHLWLLALVMGAPAGRSLALCVGAFALATAIGLLAVVTPDGLGVREAVLTAALSVVLPVPAAAVVALASRLVATVGEVTAGSVALAVAEVVHRRTSRETQTGDGDYAGAAETGRLRAAEHQAGA